MKRQNSQKPMGNGSTAYPRKFDLNCVSFAYASKLLINTACMMPEWNMFWLMSYVVFLGCHAQCKFPTIKAWITVQDGQQYE